MKSQRTRAWHVLAAAHLASVTAPADAYHLAREIKLPGAEGWD
jgi:hypothetical protein